MFVFVFASFSSFFNVCFGCCFSCCCLSGISFEFIAASQLSFWVWHLHFLFHIHSLCICKWQHHHHHHLCLSLSSLSLCASVDYPSWLGVFISFVCLSVCLSERTLDTVSDHNSIMRNQQPQWEPFVFSLCLSFILSSLVLELLETSWVFDTEEVQDIRQIAAL